MNDTQNTWLFVRGDQSIYVTRLPGALTLLVRGPGDAEHSHHFQSEASLDEFWRWYKRHILSEEWVLNTTPDRRSRDRKPVTPERRRPPREP